MIVSFEAKKVLNDIPVTADIKLYYENTIASITKKIKSESVIDQIEAIVIPEDFVSAVIDFQEKQHDPYPSVTNNEFGRAYGKILFNTETGKHVVYLDSMIAAFIMEDKVLSACFGALGENGIESAKKTRNLSLNLLTHELSHVELAQKLPRPQAEKSLRSIILQHAINLFDEYFACRKAGAIFPKAIIADDDEQFILDVEEKINQERWKYKTSKLNLNDFVSVFHQYTEMALIRLVSVLGEYAGEENESLPFANSIVGRQAAIFKSSFNSLFSNISNGNIPDEIEFPIDAILRYYSDLGVEITDAVHGLYYNIPD